MPDTALIGYTGFVGSNLLRQMSFKDLYHSKNIEELGGKSYDLLVCAGAPAEKWKANQDPGKDLENIRRLMDCLGRAKARKIILISTVDVYPVPCGVDEDSRIDPVLANAYGGRESLCFFKALALVSKSHSMVDSRSEPF